MYLFASKCYHEGMSDFVENFVCMCWNNSVIFILESLYVISTYICWTTVHLWNKTDLAMQHDNFVNYCNLFARILLRGFHVYSSSILAYSCLFLCCCWVLILFWYQGNAEYKHWLWKHPSLPKYVGNYEAHWY